MEWGPRGGLVIGIGIPGREPEPEQEEELEPKPEAPGEQQRCGFITLSFGNICTFFPC